MTGEGIAQIITSVATLATALGAVVVSLRNSRKLDSQSANVEKIEKATNSMKDALVAATAVASEAKGRAEGLQQGRDEQR
jgi:hypothetical protein